MTLQTTIRFGKVLQQLWIPDDTSDYYQPGRGTENFATKWPKMMLPKRKLLNSCNHTKRLVVVRQVQGADRLERPLNHHFSVVLPFIVTALGNIMSMRT